MQASSTPFVEIRSAGMEDAESIAHIHVQAWQQSYKGMIDQEFLDQISFKKRLALRKEILQKQRAHHLVALVEGKIIGFCDAGPCREQTMYYKGEIYAIYLLDGYKQLGIGTKLLRKAEKYLNQEGLIPYIIWVLEENKLACDFYAKHGGKVIQEKMVKLGKYTYKEIAYAFKDLL